MIKKKNVNNDPKLTKLRKNAYKLFFEYIYTQNKCKK